LKTIKPEQVVDPASYFFHRAVAEHALTLKPEANRSITGLLDDVADVPDRYKFVGILMHYDMQGWKDKDLGAIARKMDNVERRLELARGGPQTQKIQKEIVARLDELIKEMENQAKGSCNCNGGGCPNGGQPGNGGGANPSSPMQDSNIATNSGPGNVDAKKLKGLAQQWGKMPEKERAKALQDLIREMPPRHREITENYFKKLAQSPSTQP
jgi:polyhydroxyalkanoate synthesis regulator phasin